MPSYERLLGYPNFDGTGLQQNYDNTFRYTKMWVDASAEAGHKWLVGIIETNPNTVGVVPDDVDFWHDNERKHAVWGNLMAGGSGTVFFFGYRYDHSDIDLEDFRSRDHFWDMLRYARQFFMENLPFWEMKNDNDLTPGDEDYVYAKPGDIYAIYLREGGAPELDLSEAGATVNFTVQWFNPREGGDLQNGSVTSVTGGSNQSLGSPPSDPGDDWAILVKRVGYELPVAVNAPARRFHPRPGLSIVVPGESGYDAAGRFIPTGSPAAKLLWRALPLSKHRGLTER